jgi:hypothetical protein
MEFSISVVEMSDDAAMLSQAVDVAGWRMPRTKGYLCLTACRRSAHLRRRILRPQRF